MKKIISIVLLFSMIFIVISCKAPEAVDNSLKESAVIESSTAESAEADSKVHDDIPSGLSFNNETVRLFCTDYEITNAYSFMNIEEADGDVVNDSIYERNMIVSERLGVKLEWLEFDFDYGSRDSMYTAVKTSVMSGDNSYDVILAPVYFNSTIIAEGLLCDISAIPHIDLSKEYWFKGFNSSATINGKTYMAAGDGTLPYITSFFFIPFNMKLAEENHISNLYETVYDGKWTIDVMNDITKSMYKDINGDGKSGIEDQFGFELVNGNYVYTFLTSMNGGSVDIKGSEYTYVYGNEHNIEIYNKVYSLLHESGNSTFISSSHSGENRVNAPFIKGNSLFSGAMLFEAVYYRDLDFDYGILPYPKFDEQQNDYSTCVGNSATVFLVPITNSNDERTGALLEALCSEGYSRTTPAYFEITLKTKYSTDNDMSRIFDILRSTETMITGDVFAAALGGPHDYFKNTVYNKSNADVWASTSAKIEEATKEKLRLFIENVNNLE